MDKRFLIDTNIIIYYLDGKIPNNHTDKINNIFATSFNISTISKIEILGWHKISDDIKFKIEKFIKQANVLYIDNKIETISIKIKQSQKIPIPDAIIAATTLENKLTLLTRNEKDFYKIKNLKIYNPFI